MILLLSSGLCLRFIAYAVIADVPDDKGVMMYNYNGVQRKVYNPLFVANGGLKYYSEYENHGDKQSKQYFINTADWLVNNAKDKGGGKYSFRGTPNHHSCAPLVIHEVRKSDWNPETFGNCG
jgi:hypothetical protein